MPEPPTPDGLTDEERVWAVVGEDEVIHQGWIRVSKRTYRLPDGRLASWEMFGGGQSVGVLALTADGQVVMRPSVPPRSRPGRAQHPRRFRRPRRDAG